MERIIHFVQENLALTHGEPEVVIHNGKKDESGIITIFFYSKNQPFLVAKASIVDSSRLLKEYENLRTLAALLEGTKLEKTVEKAYCVTRLDGLEILFKKYLDGIPGSVFLARNFQKEKVTGDFLRTSLNWLLDFVKTAEESRKNFAGDIKDAVGKFVGPSPSSKLTQYFTNNKSFFTFPSHGNLIPSNVLISNNNPVRILNFENFTLDGFFLSDLMSIITSVGIAVFGPNQEMINKTFFEKNWFSETVVEYVHRFCDKFSINVDDAINVLALFCDKEILKWRAHRSVGVSDIIRFHEGLRTQLSSRKNDIWQV